MNSTKTSHRQEVTKRPAFELSQKSRSLSVDALTRLARNPSGIAGASLLLLVVLAALMAPLIAPYDPIAVDPPVLLQPPSKDHLFGTDILGRDVFSRVLWGARISLRIGFLAVTAGVIVGTAIGLLAGYYSRWLDSILMRSMDVLLAFPGILLAMVLVAMLGPSLNNVIIAVGVASVPTFGRVVRASVLSLKNEVYVEAARAVGAADGRIIRVHILPNALAPIIVVATLRLATAILSAAGLSFLGLGAQPPTPEWGNMLSDARNHLYTAWWWGTFPGLAIVVTVLGLNLFGDGLRDALDPRLKK